MNTLVKGKKVSFANEYLSVELEDGRIILTPLVWYTELLNASIKELNNYKFICDKTGIEWESLDYHLSIESMLKTSDIRRSA
ncbi:putative protein (DUF2442 domain) [Campylobacter iguaniorum]|uniref:DUF2442 domain-containing protein n=1 Tax=Campylobacter iguaniorum TaxID=1244531 RepID=UPI00073A479C|nr:DUF2442 domain-containing protein [Campylobacter iguaniorum]ALV25062.1 putative protein (DUF2442 domain) [Campylobacter iguaniorum]